MTTKKNKSTTKQKLIRNKFIKMYANIPLGARDEIVAVVGKTTFTYNQLFHSINDLDKVDKALSNMVNMKIL